MILIGIIQDIVVIELIYTIYGVRMNILVNDIIIGYTIDSTDPLHLVQNYMNIPHIVCSCCGYVVNSTTYCMYHNIHGMSYTTCSVPTILDCSN